MLNTFRYIGSFIFLIIIGSTIANARFEGPLYEVSEFDIYGVKLGMTPEEVKVTLLDSLGVEEKRIKFLTRGTGENRYVASVSYRWKGFKVDARFSRVLTEDNKLIDIVEEVVNENVVDLHENKLDHQVVLDKYVAQYGPATGTKQQGQRMYHYWCTKLNEFDGEDCVPDVANVILSDERVLRLSTEIYTYQSEERKFAIGLQEQFQPFSEDNLLINSQHQSPKADASDREWVNNVENCPELWTNFLNWQARVLEVGPSIDDAESNWIFPIKFGSFPLNKPPLDRNYYMQRQVLPVSNIQEIVGVAIVCVNFREYFLAAQYLSKQGELGTLLFTETDTRGMPKSMHEHGVWHSAEFVIEDDNRNFNFALENRWFTKPPEDYAAQFARAVETQALHIFQTWTGNVACTHTQTWTGNVA